MRRLATQQISSLLTLLLRIIPPLMVLASTAPASAEALHLDLVKPNFLSDRLREGAVAGKERQALVESLFRAAGCEVSLQPINKKSANVICDLAGETTATIIVGAHFDFVDKGQGIVDDWSGTSMLVSLYQTLKGSRTKHSYRFIAFAGEERGLVGSTRYVKELSAGHGIPPGAFINLECLGLTTPEVWVSRSTPILVQRLSEIAAATHIPLQGMNVENIGDDDTHPFLSAGIPVICIHSVTQENLAILHSVRGNAAAIDPTQYYDSYRLVAFYLNYLDLRL